MVRVAARLLLLAALLGARAAVAQEDPMACPVRALLFGEDLGLRRVYDGVRRGLEIAHLPRICLEEGTPAEALDRLEASPPPLLFVVGAEAAEALGSRLSDVPRVYVDVAWVVAGEEVPPAPSPSAPAAVVRTLLAPQQVAAALHAARPSPVDLKVGPAAASESAPLAAWAAEAGLPWAPPGVAEQALLHLRVGGLGTGTLGDLVRRAEAEQVPLVSDALDAWGRGAGIVLVPDHRRLGRVASDFGRRLLEEGAARVLDTRLHGMEVRVDLEACRREGLDPPLPFLAGADLVRRARETPR